MTQPRTAARSHRRHLALPWFLAGPPRCGRAGALLLTLAATTAPLVAQASREPLTFEELMRVRTVTGAALSGDGRWVAWSESPDRGDGEGVARAASGDAEHRVERGRAPVFSRDGGWVAFRVEPPFAETSKHERGGGNGGKDGDGDEPKPGLALVETATGRRVDWERVAGFAFSDDGRWLAVHHVPPPAEPDENDCDSEPPRSAEAEEAEEATAEEATTEEVTAAAEPANRETERREPGGDLVVRRLDTGEETRIPQVGHFAWNLNAGGGDRPAREALLAYSVDDPEGEGNRLAVRTVAAGEERELHAAPWAVYPRLEWDRVHDRLAFLAGREEKEGDPLEHVVEAELRLWSPRSDQTHVAASDATAGAGWSLPATGELRFSRDGERLFFGYGRRLPDAGDDRDDEGEAADDADAGDEGSEGDDEPVDPYDRQAILAERTVDVWHWDDPLIVPHQKQRWKEERAHTYLAVAHLVAGLALPHVVRLADLDLPEVEPSDAPWTVARSDVRYRKAVTWEGAFHDLYLVSLWTGERRLVAERVAPYSRLFATSSPSGTAVVFYQNGDWHLAAGDTASGPRLETRNLTAGLGVPFADEDHDYPQPPPGYGIAGWIAEGEPGAARDRAVLLYDKYDLWRMPVDGSGPPVRLTAGRDEQRVFRLVDLERGQRDPRGFLHPDQEALYLAYHDREKTDSFWRGSLAEPGATPLYAPAARLRVLASAEDADRLLYTEERYSTFPDLWAATTGLEQRRRISEVNPQLAGRDLGSAELVEWRSLDGEPLQGVLIKPAGWQPGQRVPVLVYFYRFFSQRLHEFNEPKVNHRPSFPIYATDGYAIFLPDIRFEVGRPGISSLKSLLPGVQKLIDLGVADPAAIGLHGHSWSGYQTAYIVTQTDLFAAAIAGAPVANMTSAYSGIRWGTGMARQFQYEQSQSRIGAPLWEKPQLYLENSPVFYADRVETPLLILHGDEDGAVPWEQSIELYLALRRLEKPAVFLQYRGEDHHPQKYANKLDWSIKMKEFFDHHLKGAPAPAWWSEGIPYAGK
ncbi:MAG TPA: prolyl oligopeptidase family serine peptidase [Thermoanaerobaculia bacterium]|nr:prolyl oligopeptidase family serine peptidase [Thermoanaerobaculia bacterium]